MCQAPVRVALKAIQGTGVPRFTAPHWVLAAAVFGVLSGCATVAPYERENLARTDMQFLGSPEIAESELHATVVREGSIGGFGGGGGGCGCN